MEVQFFYVYCAGKLSLGLSGMETEKHSQLGPQKLLEKLGSWSFCPCPCPLVQPHGGRGWLMVSHRTLIRAAVMVQCVEHLPCKQKGLCWDPQRRSGTQQCVPGNPGLGRQGLEGPWACCSVVDFKQQARLLGGSKTEMNMRLCLSAWGFIFRIKLGWSP